ncbi:glycosyltransferase [Empedobacter sp.]|uniref:glycosyltransferase n=1 Tax=Empedobacter sp. TaxID=1927715 RepID=UPI0028AA1F68|nr:glycosyltransferase [Empedobacter sp.]
MKILHIVEALGGGVYTYFKGLSVFFSQDYMVENCDTYIIYNDKRNEILPEKIKEDFGNKVHLIKVDMEKNINPIKDIKSTLKLIKTIRKINPDIIHLHSSKASIIGRWASFFSFKKHKLYYTPHGYSFLREDISNKKKFALKCIEKYTQSIFGGTTIACGDTEFEIAKKLGKAKLVRNGINIEEVSKHYKNNLQEKLTLGIVGRISFQKNPQLFNEIALKFPQYQFLWIGDGELQHLLTAPNIKITGWFHTSEEVYNYLNQIDLFLQTSLWEGLPIALLEALAFRKPIISTNIIGNKDIVEHGKNGFLFQNINELDNYIKKLENSTIRKQMGENSYKICLSKFDNCTNMHELYKLYSS